MLKFIIGYLRPLEMITIINYITIYTTQNRKQKVFHKLLKIHVSQFSRYMYYGILKRILEKLRDNFRRLNFDPLIPTIYCSKLLVYLCM